MKLFELLAMAPPPPPGTEVNPKAQMVQMIMMFVILGVMFYFLLIRPQQKQRKAQENLLNNLRAGDRVLTTGGLYGVVANVKDKVVVLKIADNVKVEISKPAISSVIEKGTEAGGDEKK